MSSATGSIGLNNLGNILYLSNNITTLSSNLTIGTSPVSNEQFYLKGNANITGSAYMGNSIINGNTNIIGNLGINGNIIGTSNLILLNGNIGIGRINPSMKLDVAGDANISGNLIGQSNANIIGNLGISGNMIATSNLIVLNGNVGIRTSNPNDTLDVVGTAHISGNTRIDGNLHVGNSTIYLLGNENKLGIGRIPVYELDVNGTANISSNLIVSGNATFKGNIDNLSNVKISRDLQILGNLRIGNAPVLENVKAVISNAEIDSICNGTTSGTSRNLLSFHNGSRYFTFGSDGVNLTQFYLGTSGLSAEDPDYFCYWDTGGRMMLYPTASGPITGPDTKDLLTIKGQSNITGNLIVGGKLDVNGTANISSNLIVSGNATFNGNVNLSGNFSLSNITGNLTVVGNLITQSNANIIGNLGVTGNIIGTSNLILLNGNMGIGTSSPKYTLDIAGSANISGNVNFYGNLNQNGLPYIGSQWTTSASNIYYNTGNVGIGTINPKYQLDINGNVNISGNLYTNTSLLTHIVSDTLPLIFIDSVTPLNLITSASIPQIPNFDKGNGTIIFTRSSNQYLRYEPVVNGISINPSNGFTFITKARFTGTVGSYETLFSLSGNIGSFLRIGRNGTGSSLRSDFYQTGGPGIIGLTGGTISQNANIVVALRYNPSGNTYSMWKDGSEIANISSLSMTNFTTSNLTCGIPGNPAGGDAYLNGNIYGFMYMNRFMSNDELDQANIALTNMNNNNVITRIGTASGRDAFFMNSFGNIGINNRNPVYELDLIGTANIYGNLLTYGPTIIGANANIIGNIGITGNIIGTSNLILLNGNMGIGTSSPKYTLDVAGNANISNNIIVNGSANILGNVILNANANIIGNIGITGNIIGTSNLILLNGNMGIGTSSPKYTLDVAGNANISNNIIVNGSANISGNSILNANANIIGNIGIIGNIIGTSNLIILNGNIGIGITNPTYKLDVAGSSNISGFLYTAGQTVNITGSAVTIKSLTGSGTVQQLLNFDTHGAGRGGGILFTQPDANVKQFLGRGYQGGSAIDRLTYNTTITGESVYNTGIVSSGNVTKMSLTDSGSMSLAGTLDVKGNANISGNITCTSNLILLNGNLGIKKSNPNFELDVNGNINLTGNLYQNGSPYASSQWTSNAENIYYNSGNVGIGTTNPLYSLDVLGNTNISGNIFIKNNLVIGTTIPTANLTVIGNARISANLLVGPNLPFNLQIGTVLAVRNASTIDSNISGSLSGNVYHQLAMAGRNWVFSQDVVNDTILYFGAQGGGDPDPDFEYFFKKNVGLQIQPIPSVITTDFTEAFKVLGTANITGNVTNFANLLIPNGNVGIGTSTPLYKLDVAGDANIGGNVYGNNFYIRNDCILQSGDFSILNGNLTVYQQFNSFGESTLNGNLTVYNADIYNYGNIYNYNGIYINKNGSLYNQNETPNQHGFYIYDTVNFMTTLFAGADDTNKVSYIGSGGYGTSLPLILNPLGGNVGVGTGTPKAKLEIQGNAIINGNLNIGDNLIVGDNLNITGNIITSQNMVLSNNASIWFGSSPTDTSSNKLRFHLSTNQGSFIDYFSATNGNLHMRYGNVGGGNVKFTFDGLNGNLGLGITSPNSQLQLSTDGARKLTTTTWLTGSDYRIKEDIIDANIDRCYDICSNIKLKHYKWIPEISDKVEDKSMLGWIAQDVETVFPKAVSKINEYGYNDFRVLNADQMYKVMYGALQKVIQQVENHQLKINNLESELLLLKSNI